MADQPRIPHACSPRLCLRVSEHFLESQSTHITFLGMFSVVTNPHFGFQFQDKGKGWNRRSLRVLDKDRPAAGPSFLVSEVGRLPGGTDDGGLSELRHVSSLAGTRAADAP